jgi:methionyl-tRNA formyltransferase
MLRAVFLGFERSILDALSGCAEIVGVHVAVPHSPLDAIPHWPLKTYSWRARIRELLARHPSRFRAWQRRLMHYHIADYAHERGLPELAAPSVNGERFLQRLAQLKPDIGVVANFGEILRQPVLAIPAHGFINFHPSLLPQYRGPTPIPHMMLRAEKRGGVTWHQVSTTVDAGDIVAQQAFDIGETDTVSTLTHRAVQTAAEMLPALLRSIETGTYHRVRQDESLASYFPKLSPAEKQLVKSLEQDKRSRRQPEAA